MPVQILIYSTVSSTTRSACKKVSLREATRVAKMTSVPQNQSSTWDKWDQSLAWVAAHTAPNSSQPLYSPGAAHPNTSCMRCGSSCLSFQGHLLIPELWITPKARLHLPCRDINCPNHLAQPHLSRSAWPFECCTTDS